MRVPDVLSRITRKISFPAWIVFGLVVLDRAVARLGDAQTAVDAWDWTDKHIDPWGLFQTWYWVLALLVGFVWLFLTSREKPLFTFVKQATVDPRVPTALEWYHQVTFYWQRDIAMTLRHVEYKLDSATPHVILEWEVVNHLPTTIALTELKGRGQVNKEELPQIQGVVDGGMSVPYDKLRFRPSHYYRTRVDLNGTAIPDKLLGRGQNHWQLRLTCTFAVFGETRAMECDIESRA